MNNFSLTHSFKPKLNVRIYLLVGLLLLLLPSAATFAQKITLNYQNAPLERVLKDIRKQSGYDIFFDQTLVSQQPLIVVKIANVEVNEALAATLKGLPLSFAVNGKTISIKKNSSGTAPPQQMGITVTGTIVDENGSPMAGVTIAPVNLKPIYTDAAGKFTLKDIAPLATVRIAYTGYLNLERTALAISLLSQIRMETKSINLDMTIIQGQRTTGVGTTKVDLKNRGHLKLIDVLEGTIPGLVIRSNRTSSSQKILVQARNEGEMPAGEYTLEQYEQVFIDKSPLLVGLYGEEFVRTAAREFYREGIAKGEVKVVTSQTDYGMIPELRGAGGFGAGNNAMLVVIDGFVQESFPADYPLNNVLSVEVIKDPAETIKWGPRAVNGVIIITTNGGKPGQLQMSYTSTFNFSGAPDNSAKAMQKANTAQILDYHMGVSASANANSRPDLAVGKFSPAQILLEQRRLNLIDETTFQSRWAALGQLSNEAQFREQQQGIFNQNQNLNLSGGAPHHRFSINGSYGTSQNERLGNSNRFFGLNLRDQFSLIQNKLQVTLQINAQQSKSVDGNKLDPTTLEPYQMLYNADGSYIYDYGSRSAVNELQNKALKAQYPALKDYGYNPLEEARGSSVLSKGHQLNSALNINWKLFPGFTWSSNLQYSNNRRNTEDLRNANTPYVRNLYNNNYATVIYDPNVGESVLNPPIAYVPFGDVFKASKNRMNSTNLRTGFTYNQVFNQKHALDAGFGFSVFDQQNRSSGDAAIYGYGSANIGLATLPAITATQFFRSPAGQLDLAALNFVPPLNRQVQRSLSVNTNLAYTYGERLGLQAFYNESFIPVASTKVYSSTRNYNAMASWALHKESFFKFPLVNRLKLSAGLGKIKMASLPVNLPASRVVQSSWGTTALVVNGYNPVRQNGEQISNYDGLLDVALFKDVLQGQLNYRYNSMGVKHQWSGRLAYHVSKADYFNLPFVSNLMVEGLVTNISPAQALAQMMSTNSPLNGGGFSVATGNFDLGSLPPHVQNKEIRLALGLWKERVNVDARYYRRSNSGMSNGTFQSDLSTGFGERALYSRIENKGYELYVQAKILKGDGFTWTTTANAAYNINQVQEVVLPRFDLVSSYFSTNRSGYAQGSLWSFRWAGLDAKGNPQVFDPKGNKVLAADPTGVVAKDPLRSANESWLTYSGRTTPPWSGAFIQEFGYKGFYARATLRFALGHVMRAYRPDMSFLANENSSLIAQRWRQPGDEAFTDIPSLSANSTTRIFATKYSSNSIVPADFFRLSDIQFGYAVPASWLKGKHVKSLSLTLNLQNVALWTRNKLGMDPDAIAPDGSFYTRKPLNYGLTLNVGL